MEHKRAGRGDPFIVRPPSPHPLPAGEREPTAAMSGKLRPRLHAFPLAPDPGHPGPPLQAFSRRRRAAVRRGDHRARRQPGGDDRAGGARLARIPVEIRQRGPQAALELGARRGRSRLRPRARRHQYREPEFAGRRSAAARHHPRAARISVRAARGPLRAKLPGRLPARSRGTRALLSGGQERAPDAARGVRGVPGLRDRARGEAPRRARRDGGGGGARDPAVRDPDRLGSAFFACPRHRSAICRRLRSRSRARRGGHCLALRAHRGRDRGEASGADRRLFLARHWASPTFETSGGLAAGTRRRRDRT